MIYLDNAATTKPNEDVIQSYIQMNTQYFFNPNSPHTAGVKIAHLIDKARDNIKQYLNLNDKFDIIFTSGATESNNIALQGMAQAKKRFGKTILTTKIEHPSVLETMRALEEQGFNLQYINTLENGKLDITSLKKLLNDDVVLVTCMHVNNIMGQIQPIEEISNILKDYPKVHFHVDGVQGFGKVNLNINLVDSYSLSAHKFHGLKGSGILAFKQAKTIQPIIFGGGQEYGIRSGTVNAPVNIALTKAMRQMNAQMDSNIKLLTEKGKEIRQFIDQYEGVLINSPIDAAPYILNVSFPGVKGEVLVNAFSKYEIYLSTTSACSSKKSSHNETLKAMGLSNIIIEGSIRISIAPDLTNEQIEAFKDAFDKVYNEVKELLKYEL
ncbi:MULTISPECIES: cysteine desulfurase family protein [Mammaliicoccus]|uniref:cysteine desulfurase family protein n=1 Tax=Mammaliicoccus TaxID=2803850 RepID=UPI0009937C25|nr:MULTISPECIES: cysteine desulfurase family protein [Mammaliicoccus]HCN60176.1 cysteine desulfurase [Staphylococcus sp.]MBW0764287.1 cysteine desulfurase [Mammaliicoccus fleurettii]MEB7807180.1 cysteine desulfurase [Mammaliicoccus fleurettii]OOV78379.1 aminotransferase [Mammaliicoccus fleurettii]RTX84333.1 cysteine desulfurase [Mammaliicoccus fleurettii]